MRAATTRRRGLASFLVLVAVADAAGRALTRHVDDALHVAPLARQSANWYPFALVGLKIVGAVALAALLGRFLRARATADAGERLLTALGHHQRERRIAPRPTLSLRVWAAAFVVTSLAYLVQTDAEDARHGAWSLFDPWLHTYALPVLALLAVLVAVAWSLTRWVHAVEEYAVRTFARACRILSAALVVVPRRRPPAGDRTPRRRFGLAFESRPPPLAA
jgi:hypothetical protein